ncbi:hypothetical protein L1987_20756 [Smallanthus sonchifolius]|uniref:Uncharacterized protein n=1 Tax=Smallanthus sonchifolius TaxID=185202 RepID=A0ACB9IUI1_9ASTR|nr:hypothetical protein L1987_20756 [Smallanthus sonchifolius]
MWIPILEGYKHPTHEFLGETVPKPLSSPDDAEKKAHDLEKKAHGYDTSKDLWKAIQKRFEGNTNVKKSKRHLLRKLYECFKHLENESNDDLISRFYHLLTELKTYELKYLEEELVEKFLDALPLKFDMYATLLRENNKFYDMTIDTAIGKIQAHDMNLSKIETENRPQTTIQMVVETLHVLLLQDPIHSIRIPQEVLRLHHPLIKMLLLRLLRIMSPYLHLLCLPTRTLLVGSLQILKPLKKISIKSILMIWNMAMILRTAKRFLSRTGRKFIGGHSKARVGFDKSKAKCYNCQNFGHFARECQKDKAPASGFTRLSPGNNQSYNNQNNRSQNQGTTSNALIFEMMEAKEREAITADQPKSALALMAIGETIIPTGTSLWITILECYTHPTYTWMGKDDVSKSVSALTIEEKLLFDREKKAMASISMSIPKEIYHNFKQFRTSQQLCEALQKRCEVSLDVKKSRKELLKKQFLVFNDFQNESLDDLATRFYHLLSELSSASVVYETEEINDKFLEALPSKFDVYTVLIKENVMYKTMSLEEVLGKIQSHDLNMKRKETNMEHIQDPSMYFAKSSGKTGSGFSANTNSLSSGTHSLNQRVADDYPAMFSSFMASYENFIGGKIHDPEVIEEDFRQIDPVDIEEMNIQWNMTVLMRQANEFLKKTGRKYIGSNSRSRMGFDKTKVCCYNCQEYGHFAKECVKPKVEFDSQKKPNNFQNNRNQSHGSSNSKNCNHASASSALVAQNDENYDWGIHLEDLVGSVSQAFVAEIHSTKSEDSTDDDSSSDGESLPSADEESNQVFLQNVETEISSGVSEDDIVLTQNSSDGADSENIPIAKVFMADMLDPSKIKDSVCHIYCSNCISIKVKMQKVMNDKTNLICDTKSMHSVNQKLKDNDKLCIDRIVSLKRDLNSLGLKYKEQAYHRDMAYAEIEKRNEIVAQKNKEISDKESEVIKLHRKLENLENSSVVLDYFNANADPTKRVAGIGFVPPPLNANYVAEPEIIHEEEIDPKTVLKVNPVTGEDMIYDSDSEDEVFDDNKVEGIPKELQIDEPKVVNNVTRDRCILTEPDEVKVVQPNLSKMLQSSGFVSAGYQKKNSSTVTKQVFVPKKSVNCSKKSSEACSSDGSSNSRKPPYIRNHQDRRVCFHCNEAGHILIHCPYKNQGN